jgi:S-DNA-T family DNA segregation ATPase FtsK/SpoIIIE
MSPERFPRLDLVAAGLFFTGLLVALCIFTYDPGTPAGAGTYPPPGAAADLLGEPGALLAGSLIDALGVAVYVLLATWFVVVVLLFLRRSWLRWSLRLLGLLVLLPCAAVLADQVGPALLAGPLTGSGGTLGAWLRAWLDAQFPPAARVGLLAGTAAAGVVLAGDTILLRLLRLLFGVLRRLARVVWWVLRRPVHLPIGHHASPAPAAETPDADTPAAPADAAGTDQAIPIHHHHQPVAAPGESEEDAGSAEPAPRRLPINRCAPAAEEAERFADYELPPLTLLEDARPFAYEHHDQELRERAALLEKTFTDFGLNVRVVGINTGPVITQFEVALETGLRIQKVTRLADDVALNLKAASVRMVAPIPGKNTVGIEIPNEHRADVRLKEVLQSSVKKATRSKLPLFLGKDAEGRPLVHDLADMPHLLIAGTTGTGKSVCLNAIILSMLMTRRPDEVKMIMIDPKWTELSGYGKIPHLMHPVVKDMKKAEAILAWAVDKMEERYELLSRARVRSIASYNELSPGEILRRVAPEDEEERRRIPERMPYIVIIIDEMADLMMMMKKEVEGHIIRLAQKSRAAGIHLVVATQKPTVDVITGLIKSNLPARICFKVSNKSDSRVVLDEMGGEKLLGKGDMLFLPPGTSNLVRAQATYASDNEIEGVVAHLECDEPCYAAELLQLHATDREGGAALADRLRSRDDLYEAAIEVVLREGRGSVSLLQRALGIGYGRAARLIDFMAEDGVVGAYNGSSAREVLYTPEQWEQLKNGTAAAG